MSDRASWRTTWFLAREDLRLTLRSKETWLWTFLMPLVFFYFIGLMLGESGRPPGSTQELVFQQPSDAGFLADELFERLLEQELQVERRLPTGGAPDEARPQRTLVVPEGLTRELLAGRPQVLRLRGASDDMAARHDRVRATLAATTVLADLLTLREEGVEPDREAFDELRARARPLALEVRSAGSRREPPRGFQQSVPGTLVMFTLLVLLTSGASHLTIERRQGLLARLAAAPLTRTEVVVGKLLGKWLLALVQVAFALVAGRLLFGVEWAAGPAELAALLLLLGVYCAFAAALGSCLGNLARTEGQAVGIGVLVANVLAALGGCWWPVEVAPLWMQELAELLPTGWVIAALHALAGLDGAVGPALGATLALAAATAVALWLAGRTFRFG